MNSYNNKRNSRNLTNRSNLRKSRPTSLKNSNSIQTFKALRKIF